MEVHPMAAPRASLKTGSPVRVTDLRSQVPVGVLAAGPDPLRLTWRVTSLASGSSQLAYEVQASSAADFKPPVTSSGVVTGDSQVAVADPAPALASREVRFHRVRIRTAEGWTDWSPVLRTEAGLLHPMDWSAVGVTVPDDAGRDRQAPAPLLRREFGLGMEVVRARLYVSSLGLHHVRINGMAVSEDLLAPGWTTYHHRLLAETYDVTALLRRGPNVVVATLGDGWYRGRLGWDPKDDRGVYGRELALLAQLELELSDGTTQRIVTDGDWLATTGEVLLADLYDGSIIDIRLRDAGVHLPGHDTSGWRPVAVVPIDLAVVTPRMAPPVRPVAVIPVDPVVRPGGCIQFDGGQNIAGFVRLRVRGRRGVIVTVRHAEVLEPDGSLHTRSLRSAKATDVYTLADDGAIDLVPMFTFHGFRFAEVETSATILNAAFIAISSDTPVRSSFACSDPRLDRLHDNVVWSQRDNFVSVPTDCPQRDERFGWTGDAQAFAPTASTLFDSQAFWASWLRDVALDQDDVLGVPSVVPDVVVAGDLRFGRAGWADAAAMVPWAVYESYGDPAILRDQLDSLRRWIASLVAREGADGLLGTSLQFGDWLDPDAPAERPWDAKTNPDFLANAYYSWSARLAGDAASLLGDASWAAECHAIADRVARATWARWGDHAITTQTGCAVGLRFGLVPSAERVAVTAALSRLVRDVAGRVSTGFLGTPLILPALTDVGLIDEAYLMLLRRTMPSWLYQVDQGATTVWERWDAILPDGSIHSGAMSTPPDMPVPEGREPHMLSFNHYAYGAVIDWVYRHVAGIAPDPTRPGYRGVVFAPKPAVGVDWARASVDGPYGPVAIDWRIDEAGALVADIELPFGSSGTFVVPDTAGSLVTVDGVAGQATSRLGHGRHRVTVSSPRIAGSGAG
jgi:alpha-L-rhamnosidase